MRSLTLASIHLEDTPLNFFYLQTDPPEINLLRRVSQLLQYCGYDPDDWPPDRITLELDTEAVVIVKFSAPPSMTDEDFVWLRMKHGL